MKIQLSLLIILLGAIWEKSFGQTYTELLGRPTKTEVSMNILFNQVSDVYWELGTQSAVYNVTTPTYTNLLDSPLVVVFNNLQSNTQYFYRTHYRAHGSGVFLTGSEHHFQTARAPGSTFRFAIEADPHLDTNSNTAAYTLTLQNIVAANPDFLIDLGDIFMSEKLPVINQTEITNRHLLFRDYFNITGPSIPLYLVLGNHEGELGWMLNNSDTCLPVMASNTRNKYYPNPFPNNFYSGDSIAEPHVGLRANYYAWEWGDALIVVLDPFWYTLSKPNWGWTLGVNQYNWFKDVLTQSHAKYTFVFCHNLVGGKGNDARGGAEYVDFFEMGGLNADTTAGFLTYRPGWENPIHALMKEHQVQIFFHGHDHFYGKQEKDGLIYQEVPQPSNRNITNLNASQYGYVSGVLLPGRGYILVTINDTAAQVDYIKTYLPNEVTAGHANMEVAYSYTVHALSTSLRETLPKPNVVFPNPFQSHVQISGEQENLPCTLMNSMGQEVWSGSTQAIKNQDFSKLSPGLYLLQIQHNDQVQLFKIIKQ